MFSWDTLDTIILTAQSLIADRYLNIDVDQVQPFMSTQIARNQMKTIESMLKNIRFVNVNGIELISFLHPQLMLINVSTNRHYCDWCLLSWALDLKTNVLK